MMMNRFFRPFAKGLSTLGLGFVLACGGADNTIDSGTDTGDELAWPEDASAFSAVTAKDSPCAPYRTSREFTFGDMIVGNDQGAAPSIGAVKLNMSNISATWLGSTRVYGDYDVFNNAKSAYPNCTWNPLKKSATPGYLFKIHDVVWYEVTCPVLTDGSGKTVLSSGSGNVTVKGGIFVFDASSKAENAWTLVQKSKDSGLIQAGVYGDGAFVQAHESAEDPPCRSACDPNGTTNDTDLCWDEDTSD